MNKTTRQQPRVSFGAVVLSAVTVPSLLILLLAGIVVFISFREGGSPFTSFTLDNYSQLVGDSLAYTAFWNTARVTLVTLSVAAFFSIPIAWLVERTDFGHRRLIYSLMVVVHLVF
jgi:ABC-type spermidine/putrescine transport system permease subunit I